MILMMFDKEGAPTNFKALRISKESLIIITSKLDRLQLRSWVVCSIKKDLLDAQGTNRIAMDAVCNPPNTLRPF